MTIETFLNISKIKLTLLIKKMSYFLHLKTKSRYKQQKAYLKEQILAIQNNEEQKKVIGAYFECLKKLNKNKKSLLFVSHNVSMTGAPLAVFNTAKYFKENGCEVVIISYGNSTLSKDVYLQNCKNFGIHCFESKFFSGDDDFIKSIDTFDFIFVNCALSHEIVAKINKKNNFLWRISETNIIKDELSFDNDFVNTITNCSKMFAVSEQTQDVLNKYNDNVGLLFYGIKDVSNKFLSSYHFDLNKIKFIVIGNWCYRKAQCLAFYALDLLSEEIRNKVEIQFLGDMHYNAEPIPREYKQNVKVLGFLDGDEKYKAMANADVCLCPSIDDPNPQVVMEAMMLKKPCIVTNKVGQSEYITDKQNGFIIPAADTKAIADTITYIVSNQDKFENWSENSYRLYEKYFSYEKYISQVKSIIKESGVIL